MDMVKLFSIRSVTNEAFIIGGKIKPFLTIQINRIQVSRLDRIIGRSYLIGNRVVSEDTVSA